MLTREEIEEFKKLVFEIYGIKLTDEEAADQGFRLIQLFELELRQQKLMVENSEEVVQNAQ